MIRSAKALLLFVSLGAHALAQAPAETSSAAESKSGAYYNFAMGRIYAELAQAYGNRPEYLNKAVGFYQEALKLDPNAGLVFEELTELYMATNRMQDAILAAEGMLKKNPDNTEARRALGRVYLRTLSEQGNKINEDNLKKAIEQFQKVVAKEPKDAESWVTLGRLYRVSNNSPEAEKAFNKALESEPDNGDALTQLAMLYSDLGDNARALEKLKAASDKSPTPDTLITLAKAYEDMRDFKGAADALKRAIEMTPDNVRLWKNLAQDLLMADKMDEALDVYKKLAAEEPRDASLQLRVSEIYRLKKDLPQARAALAKAKVLDGQNADVRYNEAKLLEAEGKNAEAITVLKTLVEETVRRNYSPAESEARAQLLMELGILYRSGGQHALAVDSFRKASTLSKDPRLPLQIIDTYRAAKDPENVRKEVDAAVADLRTQAGSKMTVRVQLAVASIYEKGKRFADEAAALDQAEKLNPGKDEQEEIHFLRGAMLERQKKVDAAEAEFRKVLALNPDNTGALNYLGYMLVDHGKHVEEATQMIKKALEADPDNGAYLDSLGWAYYQQGKLSEAETLLVRAIDRIGQDPTVHDHLADVYLKLGKTKEAISQWQASLKDFQSPAGLDSEPEDVAKVTRKLDAARTRLSKESGR
jgi:tetratricopeptide (TPR) repeat protein